MDWTERNPIQEYQNERKGNHGTILFIHRTNHDVNHSKSYSKRFPTVNGCLLVCLRLHFSSSKQNHSFQTFIHTIYASLALDYSCALQREILVHGRMYVTLDYMCFHANIFGWETYLTLKWKNITAITKEKTALVIPNAILLTTNTDKYFITSFAARDKTYLMLFRIWQNALMNKLMSPQEIWQCVHNSYGEKLGLTSDDEEDYIDPRDQNAQTQDADKSSDEKIKESKPVNDPKECSNSLKESNLEADTRTVRVPPSKLRARTKEIDANEIPTDESMSTDSEDENSVPFEQTAECTSMHEGRQLLHTILPINIDSLLTMLFSKSKFFAEFHNMRKTTNMVYREWIDNADGTKTRKLNFTVAITQAVGPKSSNVSIEVYCHHE